MKLTALATRIEFVIFEEMKDRNQKNSRKEMSYSYTKKMEGQRYKALT